MSDARPEWRDRVRRHERALAAGWIAAVGLLGLAVAVEPVRVRGLEIADGLLRRWDDRWAAQVREAERLVAEGRLVEAEALLERLDQAHPATSVRHGRDKEREHVLRLLGQTYEALDKRDRTIETYQRLVAFDPRHYRNHVALAEASDRLLSRATTAIEARDAWAEALRLFPAHLPSVRGVVRYHLDRGEFPQVVARYQAYLDAYLVQPVEVRVGGVSVTVPVLVDGLMHDYEVPLPSVAADVTRVEIATGGFPVGVERARLEPAVAAGRAGSVTATALSIDGVEAIAFERVAPGTWRAAGPDATLRWAAPGAAGAVRGVTLRLALYKPVDRELWNVVAKSYRNLLDEPGLAAAAGRAVAYDGVSAADRVLDGPYWAAQGLPREGDGVQD